MTVRAKICGLTDELSVQAAVDGGAAFVGLVFYPRSPRAVTAERAAGLVTGVPSSVGRVGLFVDADDRTIDAVLDHCPLDLLQLHGDESPERVAVLRERTGLQVMKVVRVAGPEDLEAVPSYYPVADWLMFDARPPKDMKGALPGGNALAFDWLLLRNREFSLPWMLAGGLNAMNVAEAVRLSGTRFVDTSSGVEDRPGVKSPEKIREFLETVAAIS